MDWRARFGLALSDLPGVMGWGEAYRLTLQLITDPSSHVAAAVAGWEYPATREALVLMDLYDAYAKATFSRPKPYPRPWRNEDKKRLGKTALPQDKVRALLKRRSPTP